ncbi:kinase domain protein [Microstroma glucosiphilum]|uniref:cAMP-dependent protein kinase n=1 Tax=Pseudomicrostroma glucosiphilum TaxID=1684307 RepID=A0A316UCC8_9BASI|nr:kinase domain protein [Pseudomicrostroma glucosiphilum]PWN20665.1 kinase domain protein [Pseudomicrostroma glucosiphilum]
MKQQLQRPFDVSNLPSRLDFLRPPSLSPPDIRLRHFDVIGTLGKGTFGQVLLVRFKGLAATEPRSYFALKAMNKRDIVRMRQVEHVNSEKDIMRKIRHPFIISCHLTFQDSKCVYLLMDFAKGGEIFSHLRRVKRFPVDVTRFYIANVVLMLEHLHSKDIVYRDLKPENLLLDDHGYLKLADFGFAKELSGRTYTLCGTPPFLAPEVISGSGHGKAADWWALGILMYELLCGYPPWHSESALGTYDLILQGRLVFPSNIDFLAQDLIRSLLSSDLTRRLGNLAGGSADVKGHAFFAKVDWTQLVNKVIPAPIVPVTMPLAEGSLLSNFDTYDAPNPESFPALLGREKEGEWRGDCEFDCYFRTF